jgi:hypothetical protein
MNNRRRTHDARNAKRHRLDERLHDSINDALLKAHQSEFSELLRRGQLSDEQARRVRQLGKLLGWSTEHVESALRTATRGVAAAPVR